MNKNVFIKNELYLLFIAIVFSMLSIGKVGALMCKKDATKVYSYQQAICTRTDDGFELASAPEVVENKSSCPPSFSSNCNSEGEFAIGECAEEYVCNVGNKIGEYCYQAFDSCTGEWQSVETSKVDKPTTAKCSNLTYNGSERNIVFAADTGYTWSNWTCKDVCTENVIARLKDGYVWADDTTGPEIIQCSLYKRSVTPTASDCSKVYDGQKNTHCTISLSNVVSGDEVSAVGDCSFADANVGTDKTVTCTNIEFINTDDSINYVLSTTGPVTTTANITSDSGPGPGPNFYTIKADANGGTITTTAGWTNSSDNKTATKNVSLGDSYGTLPTVTKTNDTFKEWNTKADGTGTKVTSSTTANSSTTIYAIWESGALISVSSVTISPKPVEVEVGKDVYLTATVSPDNATNKKVNWSSSDPTIATVDNNGKVTGVKVGTVTVTATTVDGGKTDTVQVTVKAAGSGTITHNIYFDCTTNGGTGTMTPISVNYGSTVTLPETSCTKAGYSFKNWIGYDDEGTAIENGTYQDKSSIDYTFSTDITLKADYSGSSDTYLIRYDANGGKGTMNPTEAKSGVSGTLAANTFKYAGNTFAGWKAYYKDSNNNLKPLTNKDIDYKNKATFVDLFGPNGEEVTLYAQWKVKNPNTGIIAPTTIIGGLLLISAFGYYLVKKKNIVLE